MSDFADAAKGDLHRYLQAGREAIVWKLEGLSEYDVRRPMTPTGTNLLGLVKHLSFIEAGYLGATFARPWPEPIPEHGPEAEPNADMYARADESREQIVDRYRRVWAHADATIESHDLDAAGQVAWWPPERSAVRLHQILVHVATETHRHAGHADIVRELIDGVAGQRPDSDNLWVADDSAWTDYRQRLERLARRFT